MRTSKVRFVTVVFFCLYLLSVPLLQGGASERLLTTEEWLEDLGFVVSSLKSQHPNLYYKITQSQFDSVVTESRREIVQSESDLECYFAIKRIIAR